jgi:hypothetical protein
MKLLYSLLFTVFSLQSAISAAEPVAPASAAHNAASSSVVNSPKATPQAEADATQMSDLRELKGDLTLYAAVWDHS